MLQLMKIAVLLGSISCLRGCDVSLIQESSNNFTIVSGIPQVDINFTWYYIYYHHFHYSNYLCTAIGCQNVVYTNWSFLERRENVSTCDALNESGCFCDTHRWKYIDILKIHCLSDLPQIVSYSTESQTITISLNRTSCLSISYTYKLACRQDGYMPFESNITDANTTISFEGLYSYTNYTCYIIVYQNDTQVYIDSSSSITVQTQPVLPSPPHIVEVYNGSRNASLTWDPPEFPNGIVHYSVNCNSFSIQQHQTQIVMQTQVQISNLHPYMHYHCCVSAVNSVGRGRPSCVTLQTLESSPSQSPQSLNVSTSAYYAFLEWKPPEPSSRNGNIRGYHIVVHNTTVNSSTSEESFNLTSLHPYHNYTVRVAAYTVDKGPYAVLTFQTDEDAPSAPPNISIIQIWNTSFELKLSPPPPESHNGILMGYNVTIQVEGNDNFEQTKDLPATEIRLKVDKLSPLTNYICEVAAYTSAGNGPFSEPLNITTKPPITERANEEVTEGSSTNIVAFAGIGAATVLIIFLILTIAIVILMILIKRKQRRYETQEIDTKLSDDTKDTEEVQPKQKPKKKEKGKKKWRKKEKVSNKYEIPTHCTLHDTSFITDANFDLFVEKKVEEDNISGSSSMVLELPQRQYLDDEEFSKELYPKPLSVSALLESSSAANTNTRKEMPQHVVVKGIDKFINEKNFNLFVETKTTSDNISIGDDYEGTVPQLPQRGYLEDETLDEVPMLPERRYTDEDVKGIRVNPDKKTTSSRELKRNNSYEYNPMNVATADEKENPNDDYMSLDPSTLNTRTAAIMRGQKDMYMSLTTNQDGSRSVQQNDPDYMSVNPNNISAHTESSYMSLTRNITHDNDDKSTYMSLTPGTMNREIVKLASSGGHKSAMAAMKPSFSTGAGPMT